MENHLQSQDIIDRLDRAKKAVPSDEFISRMEKMAEAYTKITETVSIRTVFMMAASFVLLLAANFLIMNDSDIQNSNQEASSENVSNYTMIPAKSIYNE